MINISIYYSTALLYMLSKSHRHIYKYMYAYHPPLSELYINFLYETIFSNWKRRVSAYTLPTIPAIYERNFFPVEAVILTSLWNFVHQATSKTSVQLIKSFNWLQIFFWTNFNEAVILIRATRERIFNPLNTMFSCRNRPFPQLIACRKWLLQKLARKFA